MPPATHSALLAGRSGRRWAAAGRIDLYLLRNLLGPFSAAVLLTGMAMMLERALRLIQELAASGADLRFFLPLLAQLVPYYAGVALPAAFMIALIFLISRLDETRELEAMLAAGLSLTRIAAPLMAFGLLVAGAALAANGFFEPQGRHGFRMMKAQALQSARLEALRPTAFYQPVEGLTISFEASSPTGKAGRVFVHRRHGPDRESLLTAETAQLAMAPDRQTIRLRLEAGLSYQDADPALRQKAFGFRFSTLSLSEPLRLPALDRPRGSDQKELTVLELLDEARSGVRGIPPAAVEAELYSRLARSLSIIFLPLLAVPLAFAAKKGRRGFGIAIGGVVLVTFHHGINTLKSLSLDGSPEPAMAFALLCGSFALGSLWLFVSSRHLPSHSPLTSLLGRAGLSSPRARAPRPRFVRLPGGTIGSYVAGTFALWTLVAAVTMVLLLQMVDLIERGDDFVARDLGAAEVGRYVVLRLPLLAQQTVGVAALAGAVLALLRLTRFSEMVAIRAAGVSLPRLLVMLLPVAAVLSTASYFLAERAVPNTQVELASWWRGTAPSTPARAERWFRIGADIVRLDGVLPRNGGLRGVAIYRRNAQGLLTERISAAAAIPILGGWELRDVRSIGTSEGRVIERRESRRRWNASFNGRDAKALMAETPQMSSGDARRALRGAAPVRDGPPRFETRLHRAAAEPLVPVVLLLLALPLALASSRTGPSWPLLLYPIVAGILYLVSDGVLTVAAQGGMIPPEIGAWAAPLAFGLLGATMLIYSDA